MTDPNMIQTAQPVVQHPAVQHVAHAAKTVAHHIPALTGVSTMTAVLVGIGCFVAGGALGYFYPTIKGWFTSAKTKTATVEATVNKDVANAKAEVSKIESEVTHAIHVG